jgi:hypothetical protein
MTGQWPAKPLHGGCLEWCNPFLSQQPLCRLMSGGLNEGHVCTTIRASISCRSKSMT